MKTMGSIAVISMGVLLLAGCPKKPAEVDQAAKGTQVPAAATAGEGGGASTTTTPLGDEGGAAAAGMAGGAAALSRKVIYFDFDRSDIKPEFADIVAANARNLTAHPKLKIKLEGNTDERGTREYNIGLGERRAQAVRRALMLQGVGEGQITTVSFGAERPAVDGDDEAAWAKNRRVELVYAP